MSKGTQHEVRTGLPPSNPPAPPPPPPKPRRPVSKVFRVLSRRSAHWRLWHGLPRAKPGRAVCYGCSLAGGRDRVLAADDSVAHLRAHIAPGAARTTIYISSYYIL